jgi:hypothetical protein
MRKQLLYLLLTVLLLFGGRATSQAATTLVPGDIAFIGLNQSGASTADAFTFITLKALSEGTVIYFTDDGWNNGVWGGSTSEVHFTWSPPAGGSLIGTVVTITNGTPSIGTCSALTSRSGSPTWFFGTGEEVLAYQSSTGAFPDSPTFIAGLMAYYTGTNYDATTKWFTSIPSANTQQASTLPNGLTNGTDCVSVLNANYPTAYKNCRYTGTLTGTASAVRALINSDANWERSNTILDISTTYFNTVSITGSVAPTVTTQAVSGITATTATGNGNITSLGSPNPTQYGVCWNTGGTPTTSDSKTTQGATSATGAFTSSITGLSASTTYYVRAYATNDGGTSYGDQVSFTTSPIAPTVTTQSVSSIAVTTATGNGNITSLGVPNPTAYGVCWNTGGTPTTSDSKNDKGAASVTGAFTASMSSLTANTTYYVRAFATNTGGTSYGTEVSFTTLTPGTWTGATDNDWGTATNWGGGSVPTSATDVTIPLGQTVVIGPTTTANCNNLTVTGSLSIQSSASGTGSLIVSGTTTGTVSAQRYMTGGKWHIMSPIVAGQTVAAFLTANNNIPTSASSTRGMMDYNTALNSWNTYYPTAGASGTMDAGKGYSARITADGTVTFSGTLTSGTKQVTLSKVGSGDWNCVGNPYSSAINMNTTAHATNNFISQNSGILDASYSCVYVWDEDASYSGQNCYKVICNSGFSLPGKTNLSQNYVAPGQGFFVKTAANNNTLQFTAAMQSHQATTALKSASVSWPGFQLSATSAQTKASTVIAFNNSMTTGLDVTYDAGLLRGTSGVELYSRLVDDNGVDFAIQCLPENYNSLVIPLGLDSKTGGEITFSAETVELPATCSVILEDKLNKTFTSLAGGATYKATVSAGKTAIGRFYIHTNSSTTGISELPTSAFSMKAYPANGEIVIEGEVGNQAKAILFDVNGRNLGTFKLQEGSQNSISSDGLAPGVYLLNVTEASKKFNTKIVIY